MVVRSSYLYRIACKITPASDEKYTPDNFVLEVRKGNIARNDDGVGIGNGILPGIVYLLGMIIPTRAKDIHRLIVDMRKMGIA